MTEKPLNVVIVRNLHLHDLLSPNLFCFQVGGSLTGLFHGVVLKRLGHNVRVLERANPDNLREHGAGIMARDDVQAFLRKHDRFSDQPYFVLGEPKIQFINQNAEVTRTWDMQLYMTSWDTLYHRLRANFDELQSDYVVMGQRAPQIGSGTASYDFGCNVTNVKYNKESVELEVERSTGVRSTLFPPPARNIDRDIIPFRKAQRCMQVHSSYIGSLLLPAWLRAWHILL